MPSVRSVLYLLLVLLASPLRAAEPTQLLAVMPVDLSSSDTKPPEKAVARLEATLRDVTTTVLTGSGWTVATADQTLAAIVEAGSDAVSCNDFSCYIAASAKMKARKIVTALLRIEDEKVLLTLRLIDMRGIRIAATEEIATSKFAALPAAFESKAKGFYTRAGLLSMTATPATASPPKPPKPHKTKVEPTTDLEFVLFEGGPLKYGCEEKDDNCFDDEKPATDLKVEPFWLGRTEVTAGAYEKCMRRGVCTPPTSNESSLAACTVNRAPNYPVNCVTWEQAQQFCKWIGGTLPTAEQWEFAAKDGDNHIYPWGQGDPSSEKANFETEDISPVGKHPQGATPAGLQDMAGNLAEWTATESELLGNMQIRGGSYTSPAKQIRTSARGIAAPDQGKETLGFRCRL